VRETARETGKAEAGKQGTQLSPVPHHGGEYLAVEVRGPLGLCTRTPAFVSTLCLGRPTYFLCLAQLTLRSPLSVQLDNCLLELR